MESKSNLPGRKDDKGKLLWSLVPWDALELVAEVLMAGARKYAPENWRIIEDPEKRYWNACQRHLIAFQKGELLDPEDNLSHLAHAGCCILFLIWHSQCKGK